MLNTVFSMRIYSYSSVLFVVLSLLLFNCSSQRIAFEFSQEKNNHYRAASAVGLQAEIPAASVGTATAIAWESAAAMATVATEPRKPTARPRSKSPVSRPRQGSLPVAFLGVEAARPTGDFNPSEFFSQPSTERGSLIGGASVGALGVAANYAAITSSSRALLLTTGHYLLWISAALLLAWFVMKLLKARKE